MGVPISISDLSTTAASNSPAGSDSISSATGPDDYLRAHAAIIKTLAGSVTTDIAAAVSTHAALADPHPLYALESALGTASTKATGTTAGTVPLVGTVSATETLAGLSREATTAEAQAGIEDTAHMTPLKTAQAITALAATITLGTKQDSTSGVAIDFTGIPATAKRVVVMFSGVSTNGTSTLIVQIGDAGGFETSGYASTSAKMADATATIVTSSTAGFVLYQNDAAFIYSGHMLLTLLDASTNLWVASHNGKLNTLQINSGGGEKALSGALNSVRITTTGGVNTFDAGSINIIYE